MCDFISIVQWALSKYALRILYKGINIARNKHADCQGGKLHWLPVQQRIHYRISSIVWHCVLGNAPSYLLELFNLTSACSGRRSLRSATKGDFLVPRARTATRQKRA